ncbi:DrmB family protein [Frankia sp. CcWB2]
MVTAFHRRVGAVRPSHLMFTSGVGALVDLPNFSAIVRGVDNWDYRNVPEYQPIVEPRLLAAVRRLYDRGVTELRPAPWAETDAGDRSGQGARIGVPTVPFPNWLRCTACNELDVIASRAFGFENPWLTRPQDARFFHGTCGRKKTGRRPLAVAARFVLACTAGHLDDFPYPMFVHRGAQCAKASHPRLRMEDRGGNLGANVEIRCVNCDARRNIREAMGRRGAEHLPRCRGRHPHLGTFADGGCPQESRLLVVGASNQWFAQTLSVLSVPRTGASELAVKVEQHWTALEGLPTVSMLAWARAQTAVLREFARWTDEEIWAAVERHRAAIETGPAPGADADDERAYPDLRTPEWEIFSSAVLPEPTDDFALRREPGGVPAPLAGCYADVVQAERLREVRALTGFTRLDAPDPDDPDLVIRAPLARGPASWVPASEVRGEGVFLRVPEEILGPWARRVADSVAMREHRDAYSRFRVNRYSDRIAGDFDPMQGWPGERFLALHTLSHLLIRTIALECGYSSASLSERIYAGDDGDPRGGILIYTAVPDAEGTLGGLVSLAEPDQLLRLTRRALADARHCSSDPLCAERLPSAPADFLHGAACHVCLFVSETTCERGNRFLDRRFVVPLGDEPQDRALALFGGLP